MLFLIASAVQGCGDAGTGRLRVGLVDAPTPIEGLEAVTIVFAGVSVHASGNAGNNSAGWIEIGDGARPAEERTFDVLQLVNGLEGVLASGDLAAGSYTQVRIVVEEASITINGATEPLTIPSGEETGIKLVDTFTITDGEETRLTADFDVGRSLQETEAGYKLHPTIRIVQEGAVGTISGSVAPIGIGALVAAYEAGSDRSDPDNIVTSTFAEETAGEFLLQALPAGSYDLEISAAGHGAETELEVPVFAGEDNPGHDFTMTAE